MNIKNIKQAKNCADLASRVDAIADKVRARHAEERAARAVVNEQRKLTQAQRREQLRASMPEIAGIVDLVRAFDPDVQVLAASENGQTLINREACRRHRVDISDYEKKQDKD